MSCVLVKGLFSVASVRERHGGARRGFARWWRRPEAVVVGRGEAVGSGGNGDNGARLLRQRGSAVGFGKATRGLRVSLDTARTPRRVWRRRWNAVRIGLHEAG